MMVFFTCCLILHTFNAGPTRTRGLFSASTAVSSKREAKFARARFPLRVRTRCMEIRLSGSFTSHYKQSGVERSAVVRFSHISRAGRLTKLQAR